MRSNAGRVSWLIWLLTEGGADVEHYFVRDDRGIDAHHHVTADGAGPEAGREDPGWARSACSSRARASS
jgi:hypothetical protein